MTPNGLLSFDGFRNLRCLLMSPYSKVIPSSSGRPPVGFDLMKLDSDFGVVKKLKTKSNSFARDLVLRVVELMFEA